MDDRTLDALHAAYGATPGNVQLLVVLVEALMGRGEPQRAAELLAGGAVAGLTSPEHRRLAARAFVGAERPEEALAVLAAADDPESLLLRARACLALDRRDEGRRAYDAAIAANAALEEPSLAAALAAKVREFDAGAGRPRLRVIAHDDTTSTELDRILAPPAEKVVFADVGGLDDVKRQVYKKIILPFQKPALFQRFRKQVGGGILLYGPPGCGKTLLARATAGECDARFFNVAISDVLDMYIGESEQKLHALFETARAAAPSVLFFDEIEALGGKRQYSREGTASKLVSQFLAEMDGFVRDNRGVLVLGATNVPWAVDPAFRRPGRFDRVMFVPPPDREARRVILGLLAAGRPAEPNLDLGFVAERTAGFSGADLGNIIETAADAAIEESLERGGEVPIADRHLLAALQEVKPTTLEWLTTARNYARYANESGQYDEVLAFLKKHGKGR